MEFIFRIFVLVFLLSILTKKLGLPSVHASSDICNTCKIKPKHITIRNLNPNRWTINQPRKEVLGEFCPYFFWSLTLSDKLLTS